MKTISKKSCRSSRPGGAFITLDAAIACALLAVLTGLVITAIYQTRSTQRLKQQQFVAVIEVGNLMEQVMLIEESKLNSKSISELSFSENAKRHLKNVELNTKFQTTDDEIGERKIRLDITWEVKPNVRHAPISLTAWRYVNGEVNE